MSVFFEYPTDLQSKAKGAVLATAFSNGDQHILAAATKNGDITMYLEEVRREESGQRRRWHNHAPRDTMQLPSAIRSGADSGHASSDDAVVTGMQRPWLPKRLRELSRCHRNHSLFLRPVLSFCLVVLFLVGLSLL